VKTMKTMKKPRSSQVGRPLSAAELELVTGGGELGFAPEYTRNVGKAGGAPKDPPPPPVKA